MTEETMPPAADTQERRQDALAASSPDDKTILMRMVSHLTAEPIKPAFGLRMINSMFAGIIMLVFVIANWGVPALLAGQTLILQWKQTETEQVIADRAVQQQQVTATREVLDAIGDIGTKLDTQAAKTDDLAHKTEGLAQRIDGLSDDVSNLKSTQGQTERSISEIRSWRRALEAAKQR